MLNPLKAILNAGDRCGDAIGALAKKSGWPKSVSAEKKSYAGGVLGLGVGALVVVAGCQIASPALLLGGLLGWLGILPGFALELAGIGVAAAATAVFGAGMVKGGDRHCGLATAALDKVDRFCDRIGNLFKRTRAPSATSPAPAPEGVSTFADTAKPAAEFAKAVSPAPSAPPPAARPALAPAP